MASGLDVADNGGANLTPPTDSSSLHLPLEAFETQAVTVSAPVFEDLTTSFVHHVAALRAANAGRDATTLVAKDIPTVRNAASSGNKDDLDTAYAEYLLTHN
jgi:hypothetical protein